MPGVLLRKELADRYWAFIAQCVPASEAPTHTRLVAEILLVMCDLTIAVSLALAMLWSNYDSTLSHLSLAGALGVGTLRLAFSQGFATSSTATNILCLLQSSAVFGASVYTGCGSAPWSLGWGLLSAPFTAAIVCYSGSTTLWTSVSLAMLGSLEFMRRFAPHFCENRVDPVVFEEIIAFHRMCNMILFGSILMLSLAFANRLRHVNEARLGWMSTLSHDVRTPLHGVLAAVEESMDSTDLGPQAALHIRAIHTYVRTLLLVLNNTLMFARDQDMEEIPSRASIKPLALKSFLVDTRAAVALSDRHNFHVLVDPNAPAAVAGRSLFLADVFQVINSLLASAVRRTPEGGDIELKVGVTEENILEIDVADTGSPTEGAQELERTASISEGPDDLSLSAVKQVVSQNLSGEITCRTRDGGSVFSLRLPFDERYEFEVPIELPSRIDLPASSPRRARPAFVTAAQAAAVPAVAQAASTGAAPVERAVPREHNLRAALNGRVLIVDDQNLNLRIMQRYLVRCGLQDDDIVACASGLDALKAAEQEPFSVALIDIVMPNMDGLELARRLRGIPSQKPMIMVAATASATTEMRQQCDAAGFRTVLSKPFNSQEVEDVLRSAAYGR